MRTYNDVFVEELVVRQSRSQLNLRKAVVILAGFALVPILGFVFANFIPKLAGFAFIFQAAALFGAFYAALRRLGIEYEYSFYSGDVEIDKIKAQRKRERVLSFSCKDIELMAPYSPEYDAQIEGRYELKIDARGTGKGDTDWFIVCRSEEGKKCLLAFSPSERMIRAFRQFVRGGKLKDV